MFPVVRLCSFTLCQQHLLYFLLSFFLTMETPRSDSHIINAGKNVWMTFNFLLVTFLQNLFQEMPKKNQPVQSSKQLCEAENRFSLKNEACQAPHCCYKSAPAYMSRVDNIPTVCAPQPLFSLLWVLVGLQLKHRPLFTGSLHISITITSPLGSAVGLISLCPVQEVRAWSYSDDWENVRWQWRQIIEILRKQRGNAASFDDKLTSWALGYFYSNSKTKKRWFSSF